MFEELSTKELVEFCMDKFCCYDVCEVLGCEDLCKEQDCPLYVLFDRVRRAEK